MYIDDPGPCVSHGRLYFCEYFFANKQQIVDSSYISKKHTDIQSTHYIKLVQSSKILDHA